MNGRIPLHGFSANGQSMIDVCQDDNDRGAKGTVPVQFIQPLMVQVIFSKVGEECSAGSACSMRKELLLKDHPQADMAGDDYLEFAPCHDVTGVADQSYISRVTTGGPGTTMFE